MARSGLGGTEPTPFLLIIPFTPANAQGLSWKVHVTVVDEQKNLTRFCQALVERTDIPAGSRRATIDRPRRDAKNDKLSVEAVNIHWITSLRHRCRLGIDSPSQLRS